MSLRLVIDMNLSPEWAAALAREGHEARHWSQVGEPHAPDQTIMAWAREHRVVVFTHDLDFGTILAPTHAAGPSVVQVRGANVLPEHMMPCVAAALRQCEAALQGGALVVVEENRLRLRILPL